MTAADLLRLLAVPALGWAAYRDVRTRRVPTRTWYPLVALGVALLAWEGWRVYAGGAATTPFARRLFLLRVGVSVGVVAPFAYLVWRLGGFGGADAKALMTLAVLFPTYPVYVLPPLTADGALVLPVQGTRLGVFSMTILTNTAIIGAAYPAFLTVRNLLSGDRSRAMVVGRRVPVGSLAGRHGSLLETPDGYTRSGLDLDALRMYLRWRDAALGELLAAPDRFRDPASVPDERFEPGDGAVDAGRGAPLAGRAAAPEVEGTAASPADDPAAAVAPDDEWGAAAFLADAEWDAYGTDPEALRAGLEVIAEREEVWYSPGIPFIVPTFLGLVVGLVYGDLLFGALALAGLV